MNDKQVVSFRIPSILKRNLYAYCDKTAMSKADVMTIALDRFLESEKEACYDIESDDYNDK